MRSLITAALVAASAAAPIPPGVYCSVSGELPPISIGPEPGFVGIDLLDCRDAIVSGGRMRATRCFANGGAEVGYDTTLTPLPDGVLVHEMELYRRADRLPCP